MTEADDYESVGEEYGVKGVRIIIVGAFAKTHCDHGRVRRFVVRLQLYRQ